MKERELKEVMGKVHIKSEMEEEILKNVRKMENEQTDKNKRRKATGWQGKAVAAAIAIAVVGAGGFTVNAVVENLAKQRMESMPKEEVESVVEEADSRLAEADTFSRELTDNERERQRDIAIAYQKGRFPKEELKRVEDESQIDKDTLCYVPTTGYLYLPERELTDEEILQLIDRHNKVNYALQKRYKEECPEEVQAEEEERQKLKQQVEADGGISEEAADAKAKEWMNKLFGETGDGMEQNSSLYSIEELKQFGMESPDGKPVYSINYYISAIEMVESYNFSISSADGTLLAMEFSHGYIRDEMPLADAEGKEQELLPKAEEYLQKVVDVSQDYAEIYCRYKKNDDGDGVYQNEIDFWFVKEDRSAYLITVDCEDESFLRYDTGNYDEYSQEREELEATGEYRKSIITKVK